MRINNLKLLEPTQSGSRTKFQVKAPNKRILEEFADRDKAISFMRETFDFVMPNTRKKRIADALAAND